jgi:hypothetical protein
MQIKNYAEHISEEVLKSIHGQVKTCTINFIKLEKGG